MKKISTSIAVALSVLALASCGTVKSTTTAGKPAPAAASSTTSTPDPNFPTPDASDLETSEPEVTEEDTPQTVRFGTTWEWEDGVAVTVSKPKPFRPSEYAAGKDGAKKFVSFTITVKNGSKQKIDLTGMANMASGDTESHEVFDSGNGVSGAPMTGILPGRKVTYKVAFGITNPNDLVLEYAPTFSHENATFTSK